MEKRRALKGKPKIGNEGFTLVELMISLTVLAVGLLALAQMQIMAIQGSAASRKFTTATNLARQFSEEFKVPGSFLYRGKGFISNTPRMDNNNLANDSGSNFAPDIKLDADIAAVQYDTIQALKYEPSLHIYNATCEQPYPNTCSLTDAEYVRVINVRNIPAGADVYSSTDPSALTIMKELNIMVLWKEGTFTHSVSLRSLVGRKNHDFY